MIHETEFHTRNGDRSDARARCKCGWFHFGPLAECQTRAAVHDTEWQAVEVAAAPAPAHA